MVKMKVLVTLLLMIIHFQVILSSDEISQNSVLERLDSIEAVQELNSLKIEQVETLFTGLKGKVERLEIKDKDILGDLGKLDRKIADISSSVSSLSSSKITAEQRLQSHNGIQFELSGDEITKYAVSDGTAAGPSSCQDLRKSGHNLEGFYTTRFNATVMKIMYCDFYGNLMSKTNPSTMMTTSTTTLTTSLKSGANFKVVIILPLDHNEGKSYPLMNKHGKCLAVETTGNINPSENGATIVQSTCNPTEKGQLWKYDQRKFTICNDWNKCLSIPLSNEGWKTVDVFQWDRHAGRTQLWIAIYGNQFSMAGFCLTSEGNSDAAERVRAVTNSCDAKEKGQIWSFVQY